jgi:hypothetical protein
MNCLEQTSTSYKEELDTLLFPNFNPSKTSLFNLNEYICGFFPIKDYNEQEIDARMWVSSHHF